MMYNRSAVCNRLGMDQSKGKQMRSRARALARRLEGNEVLLERFESILELAEGGEGGTLDEVEAVLIEEVRKLGGETLGHWAARREETLAEELRESSADGVRQREKKRCSSTPPSDRSV